MGELTSKEHLIYMRIDQAAQNGYDMDHQEARAEVDDLLVRLGTPVKYYRSLNTEPYTFHWRRVGVGEIGEFDRDDTKVEISEGEYRAAIDMHELGLD